MGAGLCKSTDNTAEPQVSPLEKKLIEAVVSAKSRYAARTGPKPSFNGLLLQFPKMRPGFMRVQQHHKKLSNKRQLISHITFRDRAHEIGLDATNKELASLFSMADVNNNGLDADELTIVYTVCYLVNTGFEHSFKEHPDIRTALEVVEKAFTYFDSSADGYLEKNEVMEALGSGTKKLDKRHQKTSRQKTVGERLFDELDLDHSGRVSFKEFLLGMVRIVCSDQSEEEEEEMRQLMAQESRDEKALARQLQAKLEQHQKELEAKGRKTPSDKEEGDAPPVYTGAAHEEEEQEPSASETGGAREPGGEEAQGTGEAAKGGEYAEGGEPPSRGGGEAGAAAAGAGDAEQQGAATAAAGYGEGAPEGGGAAAKADKDD